MKCNIESVVQHRMVYVYRSFIIRISIDCCNSNLFWILVFNRRVSQVAFKFRSLKILGWQHSYHTKKDLFISYHTIDNNNNTFSTTASYLFYCCRRILEIIKRIQKQMKYKNDKLHIIKDIILWNSFSII